MDYQRTVKTPSPGEEGTKGTNTDGSMDEIVLEVLHLKGTESNENIYYSFYSVIEYHNRPNSLN